MKNRQNMLLLTLTLSALIGYTPKSHAVLSGTVAITAAATVGMTADTAGKIIGLSTLFGTVGGAGGMVFVNLATGGGMYADDIIVSALIFGLIALDTTSGTISIRDIPSNEIASRLGIESNRIDEIKEKLPLLAAYMQDYVDISMSELNSDSKNSLLNQLDIDASIELGSDYISNIVELQSK